jgi:hypothetical protein
MRLIVFLLLALVGAVHGFFDFGQMFGGGGGGGPGHGQQGYGHRHQPLQNAPSDPGTYQRSFDGSGCMCSSVLYDYR